MAEATISAPRARQGGRKFYAWMAVACLAVAVLGFLPTYFMPLAQGSFSAPPIVHIHGWLFFAWTIYFCVQTAFVANGDVRAHRNWGLLGISLATAMVFTVFVTAVTTLNMRTANGFGDAARAFTWVQVSGALFFAAIIALAIVNVGRPEVHKRLMLLATISLLEAPIARWFVVLLAPPGLDPLAPPPVAVTIAPGLVADLLLVAAMVFDWRTRGKPHPVYLIGGAALLAVQLTAAPISATPLWLAIAEALSHLFG